MELVDTSFIKSHLGGIEMTVEEIEIRYKPNEFKVFLHLDIAGQKRTEEVVEVKLIHQRILLEDLLVFVLRKLSWLFSRRIDNEN